MNALDRSKVFIDLATNVLRSGYRLRFRAEGGSMWPTICLGEAVIVEPITATEVKLTDIVLYRTGRGLIGHRVVGIASRDGKRVLLTRGDADQGAGEPVVAEQILGRLVAVERDGRCIALAGRKAKAKHLLRVRASRCKDQVRHLLIAKRSNWRSPFGLIRRRASASNADNRKGVSAERDGAASIFR